MKSEDNKIICYTQDGRSIEVQKEKIQERSSSYGVLYLNQKVLLVKSVLNLLEFPGGRVEKDETLEETLIREVKEETDLEVKINDLFYNCDNYYYAPSGNAYHSHQYFFKVDLINDLAPKQSSMNGCDWHDLSTLNSTNFNHDAYKALQVFKSMF
ncbi:MAG: NUDIX hydrolase [bacterium]|nr:NUDIX hydrolase [bacterium]